MPWTCIRCESVNVDSDDTCEVCDERRGLNLPQKRQSIAAGGRHSLAITATGTVVAWGDSEYGKTRIPKNLCDVVAVAAVDFHSLALTGSGAIVAWGDNSYGQTNVPE
jgi:alpha-tubulin suppressor-like RCC1 family protein